MVNDLNIYRTVTSTLKQCWNILTYRQPDYTPEELYILVERLLVDADNRNFVYHLPLLTGMVKEGQGANVFEWILKDRPPNKEVVMAALRPSAQIRRYTASFSPEDRRVLRVMFHTPLEDLPIYAFHGATKYVAQWRLEIGK